MSSETRRRHTGSQPNMVDPYDQLGSDIMAKRAQQREARKHITMLTHPIKTLYFFVLVCRHYLKWLLNLILHQHRSISILLMTTAILYAIGLNIETPLQQTLQSSWYILSIAAWWIGLGFLSSFGLGTGLHTFVLYLGPFIASATLAASECQRTDFDKYGPNKFICTEKGTETPSFFAIWQLIALEAFLWGAGTAIGELPPYFVARAARLAGERLKETGGGELDSDDEDLLDVEELSSEMGIPTPATSPLTSPASSPSISRNRSGRQRKPPTLFSKAKKLVIAWLGRIGFLGILLFASIPNPLFDLAGLTCGHMLVPFATFFMATLIGKAVVKVNLQTFFIIAVFNKTILEALVQWIDQNIPFASGKARAVFDGMREKYHRNPGEETAAEAAQGGKGIMVLWDIFLAGMIIYFVISIINSSVQEYLVHRDELEIEKFRLERESKIKAKA